MMATVSQRFEFIDGTRSDRYTRRKARSHAMKGKNLGRTLSRRSRLELNRATAAESPNPRASQNYVENKEHRVTTQIKQNMPFGPIPYIVLSDIVLSDKLPIEVSAHARYAIREFMSVTFDAFYPSEICSSQDKLRAHWLRMFFADLTSYHCTIALMISLSSFVHGSTSIPPEALYHLGQAVSLVNASLGTPAALSDSNLSVVVFLVLQGLVREEYAHAKVHMDGLKRMVELRGGLDHAGIHELLLIKICKTEIDFALHYGTPISFYHDRMPFVASSLSSDDFSSIEMATRPSSMYPHLSSPLHQILAEAIHISTLFNRPSPTFRIDPHLLQDITVSLGTRLLAFHALLDPPLSNSLDAVIHIGLVAFMSTLFLQVGKRRYLKYKLVAERVREIGERALDSTQRVDEDVLLWLLCMGGVSVLDGEDRKWAVSGIRGLVARLGVDGWIGMRGILGAWPWIGLLHDENGETLWKELVCT